MCPTLNERKYLDKTKVDIYSINNSIWATVYNVLNNVYMNTEQKSNATI